MTRTTRRCSTSSPCSTPSASRATSGAFSGSAASHDPRVGPRRHRAHGAGAGVGDARERVGLTPGPRFFPPYAIRFTSWARRSGIQVSFARRVIAGTIVASANYSVTHPTYPLPCRFCIRRSPTPPIPHFPPPCPPCRPPPRPSCSLVCGLPLIFFTHGSRYCNYA